MRGKAWPCVSACLPAPRTAPHLPVRYGALGPVDAQHAIIRPNALLLRKLQHALRVRCAGKSDKAVALHMRGVGGEHGGCADMVVVLVGVRGEHRVGWRGGGGRDLAGTKLDASMGATSLPTAALPWQPPASQ
jgi:hypothetical protein